MLFFVIFSLVGAEQSCQATKLESEIFRYDGKYLHVALSGTTNKGIAWKARDVAEQDITFHQDLFADQRIMSQFGTGEPRDLEATRKRIVDVWIPRFRAGHPHGGLTVCFEEGGEACGHAVAGAGEAAGVSEMAYAYPQEHWGKGLGYSVAEQIVTRWAPEVRRIGTDQSLDDGSREAFCCFGGKPLERVDATASPSNISSWKILDRLEFQAAKFKVSQTESVADFSASGLEGEALEQELLKRFNPAAADPFQEEVRYHLRDGGDKRRTFSKHKGFNRLKYHFEKNVE